MAITNASLAAKKRILTACVRLFLEKGYNRTTVAEILREADVSASTFQNIFRAKDGVLVELVKFMFSNQFGEARKAVGTGVPPVYIYAAETAVQLTLTELNENLRDIYLEAYTQPEAAEYIHQNTSTELYRLMGSYLPGYSESDFYELDIGTAGIMRGYMSRKCDKYFTLEKKLHRFLTMTLGAYKVPEEEQEKAIAFVDGLDIKTIAEESVHRLFETLAMQFDFSLDEVALNGGK